MDVFQLSYRSSSYSHVKKQEIDEIVKISNKKNLERNVTGCLIFHENTFFQILEGSKTDVLHVFKSIEKDERHKNVIITCQNFASKRIYEEWGMILYRPNDFFSIQEEIDVFEERLYEICYLSSSEAQHDIALWKDVKKYYTAKIYQIAYRSIAVKETSVEDIKEIARKAKEKTLYKGITGCLIFYNNRINQLIEGDKKGVLRLFETIKKNPRYSEIEIICESLEMERLYSNYSTIYYNPENKNMTPEEMEEFDENLYKISFLSSSKLTCETELWKRIQKRIF